jgi:hypothetical protein
MRMRPNPAALARAGGLHPNRKVWVRDPRKVERSGIMPCGTTIFSAREWDEMEPRAVPSHPIPLQDRAALARRFPAEFTPPLVLRSLQGCLLKNGKGSCFG